MPDRVLYRLGAASAIAGAVLALVMNGIHPRFDDYDNFTAQLLDEVAGNDSWVGIHVGILVAVVLILLGIVSVVRSIRGSLGEAFGRLSVASAIAGTAVGIGVLGLDGGAIKAVAEAYATTAAPAGQEAATFAAADVLVKTSSGLSSAWFLTLFGVTPVLLGVAMAWGEGYPRWLGWAGLVLGGVGIAAGIMTAYDGTTAASVAVVTVGGGLLSAWILWVGVLLWRKSAVAQS